MEHDVASMENEDRESFYPADGVFVALGCAVLIQALDYLWAWGVYGESPFNSTGVFNGKVQVSYLANLFLSLCMAEAFSRLSGGGRYFLAVPDGRENRWKRTA